MAKVKIGSSGVANNALGARLAFWLILAAMAFGLYEATEVGRTMRVLSQDQVERTLAAEDRAFCEKFGMRPGGNDYADCCRELSIIRRKQTDRDAAVGQGLL
jgi:hypothetical protein